MSLGWQRSMSCEDEICQLGGCAYQTELIGKQTKLRAQSDRQTQA